ncbi:6-hydroxy-D-nicotine oxidase [Beauveria bassiana]|nr:6-hydroxy-D-nicotine oxidase [Beauveria bassiana]
MAVLAEPHYVADVPAQLLPLVSEAAAVNGTDGQGCHLAVCFDPNQKPNWESQNSALTGIIFSPSANRSLRPPAWTSSCTTTTAPPSLPASRPASTPCSSASSSPLCVAEPLTAEGVAISVRAVTRHSCRFAVKSGGHSNALGTNARQSGVVIDLGRLDRIEVSGSGNGNGSSTVFIGPGNHGGRVYEELEPRGLAVAGGRVDWVGVGGFTLGGGISFLSPRHGWAVDNFWGGTDVHLVSPPHNKARPRAGAVGPHARGDAHEPLRINGSTGGRATFRADAALLVRFWELFMQESGCAPKGGNAFGLRAEDGPLFLFVTTTAYAHAQDDEAVSAAAERIHARLGLLGRARGLDHPFIYPNYAAAGQDVFAGYAPEPSGEAAGKFSRGTIRRESLRICSQST